MGIYQQPHETDGTGDISLSRLREAKRAVVGIRPLRSPKAATEDAATITTNLGGLEKPRSFRSCTLLQRQHCQTSST